ncbi:actin cytoskeleton and mitosis protein [Elasticomyces elasticus]|nr:actin cytoskeleton and mitosis protein [Elasticomyces elasticus]
MSLARGRGTRGRGNGGPPRGASPSRGVSFLGAAQRGSRGTARGTFGQPSRGTVAKPARFTTAPAKTNGFNVREKDAGALGGWEAPSTGGWSSRFEALTNARERERTEAIRQGLIADPDKPRSLADAITPVGTCQDMCAEYERVQRVVQNDVTEQEKSSNGQSSNGKPEPDETRMVKKFRRAAAGIEEQLPSDLRPPFVLKRTCDYLFDDLIANAPALKDIHHFVWDRTRAVRNDFSIQQLTKAEDLRIAIDCYERIARFHIVSLHLLAVQPRAYSNYDAQQEREQLDRTLLSLMQFYDDARGQVELENEAEFRAYCVIFQLQDPIPDMEDRAQSWPRHIVKDRKVRAALELYAAASNTTDAQGPLKPRANHLIAQQDFQRFWTIVDGKQVSYLMACVAEIYFNLVRRTALSALSKSYRVRNNESPPDLTLDVLRNIFMFDSDEQVYTFCEAYGFTFTKRASDGEQCLDLGSTYVELGQPDAEMPKQWRSRLVEQKRFGRTIPSIIQGMTVQQARQAGLVTEEEHDMETDDVEDVVEQQKTIRRGPFEEEDGNDATSDDEQSLFVQQPKAAGDSAPLTPLANGLGVGSKPATTGLANGNGYSFGKPSDNPFGQPSGNTFGKPSGNPFGQPSGTSFGQPSGTSFGQPSGNSFGQPSGNSFGKPSIVSNGAATQTPAESEPQKKMPLFDFLATPNAPQATITETPSKSAFNISAQPVLLHVAPQPQSQPAKSLSEFKPPSFDRSSSFNYISPAQAPAPKAAFVGSLGSSVFAQPPVNEAPTKLFNFGTPQQTQTAAVETNIAPSANERPTFTPSGSAIGQRMNAEVSPSPPLFQTEDTKTPPAHFTPATNITQSPAPPKPTSPEISVERRNSLNRTYKPGKPSPLAHASSLEDVTVKSAPTVNTAEEVFTRLAKEIFHAPVSGFLDQYLEYTIGQAIVKGQEQVRVEAANARADEFRQYVLEHRYGRRWREVVWRTKQAAKATQRRERARRGLEEARSRGASVAGGSRASSAAPDRQPSDVMDSMFQQSTRFGAQRGASSIGQQAGVKRPLPSQAPEAPAQNETSHKRQKSTSHVDERGRVSKPARADDAKADLLRRSAFLGFSSATARNAPYQRSTTQTNYFRLKALGINPTLDTTEARGTKRRRSESVDTAASAREDRPRASSPLRSSAWRPSATTNMPPPARSSKKKDDGDEELFARLKAARENLAKSTSLLKSDVAKQEELRRSFSASQSSNDSPSMIRARAEARWRASQKDSIVGMTDSVQEGPAYRFRESKFVPRENYGKAVERANEFRKSRSRDASRPESRFDESVADSFAPAINVDTQPAQQVVNAPEDPFTQSKTPNGNAFSSLPKWEPPPPPVIGTASAVPPQPTWSFPKTANQPFGMFSQPVQDSENTSFASQPAFGGTNGAWPSVNHNFTIQPSQVEQTLSNSFGHAQTFGQPSSFAPLGTLTSTQPDTYDVTRAASDVISLLSDDEGDNEQQSQMQFAQAPETNGDENDTEETEVLDEYDEEVPGSYQYTNPNNYSSNPYAALADEVGGDTEEDVVAELEYESEEGSYDEEEQVDGQGAQVTNGYYQRNGFEEEDEDDGDIEDAEDFEEDEEFDEEDDPNGVEPAQRQQQFPENDDDMFKGFEDDEGESTLDPSLDVWRKEPSVNPSLQVGGSTVEEAIELSD